MGVGSRGGRRCRRVHGAEGVVVTPPGVSPSPSVVVHGVVEGGGLEAVAAGLETAGSGHPTALAHPLPAHVVPVLEHVAVLTV